MRWLGVVPLFLACVIDGAAANGPAPRDGLVVNGKRLTPEEVHALEQRYSVRTPPGRYWYDPVAGAWGFEGGPTMGFVRPGATLGGPLRADASGGGTGVFINGRELHPLDVWALSQLGPVWRGRWWVNAQGWFGPENGPAWGNLWAAAAQRSQQNSPYSGGYSGKSFLGRDTNGCMYYQGSSQIGGGALTHASPGC